MGITRLANDTAELEEDDYRTNFSEVHKNVRQISYFAGCTGTASDTTEIGECD